MVRFVPRTKGTPERHEYECFDPFELLPDAPVARGETYRRTLGELYAEWRKQFSLKTTDAEWRAGLSLFMCGQRARWLAACTLLEVERPETACVAIVRLHDDPNEYARPCKFGDVVINWAPCRDVGTMTFADRATTNSVVGAKLLSWLERHRVIAQLVVRVDTADAQQADSDAPLHYVRVYRKLFQKAVIS